MWRQRSRHGGYTRCILNHRKVLVTEASPVPSESSSVLSESSLVPAESSPEPAAAESSPESDESPVPPETPGRGRYTDLSVLFQSPEKTEMIEDVKCPAPLLRFYYVQRSSCLTPASYYCTLSSCLVRVLMYECCCATAHSLSEEIMAHNDNIYEAARATTPPANMLPTHSTNPLCSLALHHGRYHIFDSSKSTVGPSRLRLERPWLAGVSGAAD